MRRVAGQFVPSLFILTTMDELLHHCLREMSFDGDLGCKVSRLRDFVVDFYAHSATAGTQNPDDAFCAFVWSLVVQQPMVIVGTVPEGITSEVWIAPQNSMKRKAKEKGEEIVLVAPPTLDIVLDAKDRPLDDLVAQYGDKLRIATNPDTTYAAITGTHIRFPKMSPMVYSALQIITRGRENGVSVVELGQQSTYDQKTCFYLVKQLTELDLIVKVRRGGIGSNFCIHKYFFERSKSWQEIREEETRAATIEEPSADVQEEDGELREAPDLQFSPIDARHLSSMPLVKARVLRLLKVSKNQMHASHNMLIAIGFLHPTRTDRRFFASRMRELVDQRVIESVFIAAKRKGAASTGIKCFRLVSADSEQASNSQEVVAQHDDDIDDQSGVKINMTIHNQIISLVEESGTVGMTLNELATALCQFDKRTIELLLTRVEKFPPPPHLSDLGIAGLMETNGRERRNRYYTIGSYRALVAQENLDQSSAGYSDVDLGQVGDFYPFGPEAFYSDNAALIKHQDREMKMKIAKHAKKPGKLRKNPILPDGTVKKGRPRKHRLKAEDGDEAPLSKKRKRKAENGALSLSETQQSPPAKKQRLDAQQGCADDIDMDEINIDPASNADPLLDVPAVQPKRRGRPPKKKVSAVDDEEAPTVKKRGRPTKKKKGAKPSLAKKSSRPAKAKSPSSDAKEVTEEIGFPDWQDATPPQEAASLQSPQPASSPLTPLTPVDCIPPVASLVTASSSPLTSVTSSPPSESPPLLDELQDDTSTSMAADNRTNPAPLSPTLLTLSLLDDVVMRVDPPGPDTSNLHLKSNLPIDPILLVPAAAQATLPEPLSIVSALDPRAVKQKVNVSTLRRENELFRVLELLGGIVNTQTRELYDAHLSLLTSIAQAGEPASAPPGTKLDRRTATAAYNNMELRSRVKQLKTTVTSLTGLTRSANLVYLPHITDQQLSAFLAEVGRNVAQFPPQINKPIVVDQHTEYGSKGGRAKPTKPAAAYLLPSNPRGSGKDRACNSTRADESFSCDEDSLREVLATERTTIGQKYGYIPAKMIRTREFHLRCLDIFETSSHVVSRKKRIAAFPFFYNEIPLDLYCELVAAIDGDDDLARLLSTEQGRNTPVKDLPPPMHQLLQIGRTRGRGRILELLDILRSLGLAIPLEPADSGPVVITCELNGNHPMSFRENTSEGWSSDATTAAPNYWHFTSVAPVYHWAESEIKPSFLRSMPVNSRADAVQYWDYLRSACNDTSLLREDNSEQPSSDMTFARKKAKTIRRRASWVEGYSFTWHQTDYIRRKIRALGHSILEGAEDQIQHVSRIISAPEHAVREFFQKSQSKKALELEKAVRRMQEQQRNKARFEETKASLARKAADAIADREAKWEALVKKVHPSPLPEAAAIRLRRVRTLYLQSTGAKVEKWESEIAQAVHETNMVTAINSLPNRQRYRGRVNQPPPASPSDPLPPPPTVLNPPEKPIATLIGAQGPLVVEKIRSKKRGQQPSEETPVEKTGPRTRFHWNKDYEELAKDAMAIIHSRCRARGKVEYAAIKQVFPGISKQSVRHHMKAVKDVPAMAAYMSRLEDHWHELWVKYRGTPHLPDNDVLSLEFDLIAHIEFLRKHIDKNALRVGFAQEEEKKNMIPASIEELMDQFEVIETPAGAPMWDFMWSATVDEGREKRALRQALTTRPKDLSLGTENCKEEILLAESVLKMTMGTVQESYDPEAASQMLHAIGEAPVQAAQKNLLGRGVLSKRFRNPNSKPGRMLKISDSNSSAIGGSIARDTFQDAAALEEISTDDQSWREWPLLSTDGDTAALIQLVSDDKVKFKIDTSQAQAARTAIDWNSKKADDDHIETAIFIQFHDIISIPHTPSPIQTPGLASMNVETVAEHGTTEDGSPACCKRVNDDSLIDCPACIEEEWGALYASLGCKDRDTFQLILDTVTECGAKGITKRELLEKTKLHRDALLAAIRIMTEEMSAPPIFWAGYSSLVLVASVHLQAWTVQMSLQPLARMFPRRWIDMTGSKVVDLWEAATRAVIGVLVFHPGVTEGQLRWRLRSVYDRQEVNEVLRFLADAGFVDVRGGTLPADDDDEVCLFIGRRHWYQL
ncbi:hypothetical protein GGX14DRAFT_548620 [Mycena pura]|uniref:Uncharacterized protein n=1 Tax=Mycena pura TaxID=153505 RepID=A0AAD7E346_9AGAR|nr:hypothetical protein GGX14DRAFT_548620 [Mycena pura]